MVITKKGFTLVELLVVMAIIALLVTFLLPSLTRARHHAKVVCCLNNIRAQYYVQFLYANDHQGEFPEHWDYVPWYVRSGNSHSRIHSCLKEYMDNSKILICPVIEKLGGFFADTHVPYAWDGDETALALGDPVPPQILIPYAWFANLRSISGDEPIYNFISVTTGQRCVSEPFPKNTVEANGSTPFISHLVIYHESFDVFWDCSHGGKNAPSLAPITTTGTEEMIDTPVGYGDGHAVRVMKTEMEPRVRVEDSGGYPSYEIWF